MLKKGCYRIGNSLFLQQVAKPRDILVTDLTHVYRNVGVEAVRYANHRHAGGFCGLAGHQRIVKENAFLGFYPQTFRHLTEIAGLFLSTPSSSA